MTDNIDPSKIRPARGLWAAVRPDGAGGYQIIRSSIGGTKQDVEDEFADFWQPSFEAGWRIIRVYVVPHEGGSDD